MRTLLFLFIVSALIGCMRGSDSPDTVVVRGTVSIDGQPIPLGNIDFEPVDGLGRSCSGVIEGGKFEFRSPIGHKKVMIFASRKSGKKGEEFGNDLMESYIPEKYNTNSSLTATVAERGENRFLFELQSANSN